MKLRKHIVVSNVLSSVATWKGLWFHDKNNLFKHKKRFDFETLPYVGKHYMIAEANTG